MPRVLKKTLERASVCELSEKQLEGFDSFVKNYLKPAKPAKVLKVLQGDIYVHHDIYDEDEADKVYFMIVFEGDIEKDFDVEKLFSLQGKDARDELENMGLNVFPMLSYATPKELRSFGYEV